jgi:hypothetical protein
VSPTIAPKSVIACSNAASVRATSLLASTPGPLLGTLGTILPALIYGATICLYLVVRTRLARQEGAFNLGRVELPVAIAAVIWVIVAVFVLECPGRRSSPT